MADVGVPGEGAVAVVAGVGYATAAGEAVVHVGGDGSSVDA